MKILQVLIAFDQLVNTLLGGWADETLSSRAHRTCPKIAKVIDILFWFDKNHCEGSYLMEQRRSQMPPELR